MLRRILCHSLAPPHLRTSFSVDLARIIVTLCTFPHLSHRFHSTPLSLPTYPQPSSSTSSQHSCADARTMICAFCSGLVPFTLSLAWERDLDDAEMCGCCRSRCAGWIQQLLHMNAAAAYSVPPALEQVTDDSASEQPNLMEYVAACSWFRATHRTINAFSEQEASAYTTVAHAQGRQGEVYTPITIGAVVCAGESQDGWTFIEGSLEDEKDDIWTDVRAWCPSACLEQL